MKALLTIVPAIILAAACQNPAPKAEAKPDPRQGQEVAQICFQTQIRSWESLNDKAVIVEKGVHDQYKLDLIGPCQPEDAFVSIGLVSRGGSSCLTRGDHVFTDARFGGAADRGACLIRAIYEWHPDKKPDEKAAETAPASSK